ncbi:hypothetical protein BD769DRAFT_582483 [Suillus cothurnatus]|nr:hypothetical protein BD769DRAFT_582483 [Suillus cothurnatus]
MNCLLAYCLLLLKHVQSAVSLWAFYRWIQRPRVDVYVLQVATTQWYRELFLHIGDPSTLQVNVSFERAQSG